MSSKTMDEQALKEMLDRHRDLYDGPAIDPKLKGIIRDAPCSKLSDWDIHRMLRTSRSVFFDTHVEVVSGHHTSTYLRYASIARFPQLVRLIVRDNGRGFEPDSAQHAKRPGFGLISMRERAAAIGGELRIDSHADTGTTIEVKLP